MTAAKFDAAVPESGQADDHGKPPTAAAYGPILVVGPVSGGSTAGQWLYADKPLQRSDEDAKDALSLGAYADALSLVMDAEDTATPLTIAISGPWGSGKTSLAAMTEARLGLGSDWSSPHVICKFDAWANDDAPHLGAAFAAAVAKAVDRERHWWVRLFSPLPSVMLTPTQRWRRGLRFWIIAIALAVSAIFWRTHGSLFITLDPASAISSVEHGKELWRFAWPAGFLAVFTLVQKLGPGIQAAARWIDDPKSEAARGSVTEASEQLGRFIDQALRGKRRLMIFVDNLERCRPPRAVEVCEVVTEFIGHEGVVTVLIGDMDTIALSAEIKYAALESVIRGPSGQARPGSRLDGDYGRAFLEKLIQMQLRLPPPLPGQLRAMLSPSSEEPPAFTTDPDTDFFHRLRQVAKHPGSWPSTAAVAAAFVVVGAASFGAELVVAVPAAGFASAIIEVSAEYLKAKGENRKRETIDHIVKTTVSPSETTLRLVGDVCQELGDIGLTIDVREISRRVRQRIISTSSFRFELDRSLHEVLPSSPRGAKRMVNHAHLLLDIGVGRGVFAKPSGVRPAQLASWASLTERWPSVAAAVARDPSLVGRLEEIARQGNPVRPEDLKAIEKRIGVPGIDLRLLELLRRSDTLAPVAELLVNFSRPVDSLEETATSLPRGAEQAPALTSREDLYIDGLAALLVERWEDAARIFGALVEDGRAYKDAKLRLDHAVLEERLSPHYHDACSAADSGQWAEAIQQLEAISASAPTYRDVQRRLNLARAEYQLLRTSAEAFEFRGVSQWEAVLAAAEHLRPLREHAADIDEIVGKARISLRAAEHFQRAVIYADYGEWREAMLELAEVRRIEPEYKNSAQLVTLARRDLAASNAVMPLELHLIGQIRAPGKPSLICFTATSDQVVIVGRTLRVTVTNLNGDRLADVSPSLLSRLLIAALISSTKDSEMDISAAADFDHVGGRLAISDLREGTRILDAATGEFLREIGSDGSVALAFQPDGTKIATVNRRGILSYWDTRTGELDDKVALRGVRRMVFSPDGQLLLVARTNGAARVLHLSTGDQVGETPRQGKLNCLAFAPDGRTFATGGSAGARVFTTATGALLAEFCHGATVADVAYSPDGRMLATASERSTAQIWDSSTGELLAQFPHASRVDDVLSEYFPLLESMQNRPVQRVAFSPDGQMLAVGVAGHVRLWRITP
jgi:tetratricopeptide (TPR) repeat protein